MRIIDEGQFIKLLPDDGMVLTDVATETMRTKEIDLGKSDNEDNYMDIPEDTPVPDPEPEPTGDLTVPDTLAMLNQMGVETDDQ